MAFRGLGPSPAVAAAQAAETARAIAAEAAEAARATAAENAEAALGTASRADVAALLAVKEAHTLEDHIVCAPTTWTLLRTTYTPKQDWVEIKGEVDMSIAEWPGAWSNIVLHLGDDAINPLNNRSQSAPPAGVGRVTMGKVWGPGGHCKFEDRITGLTPGDTQAVEVTASVTGGALQYAGLEETPTAVDACSLPQATFTNARFGDQIVVARTPNYGHIFLWNNRNSGGFNFERIGDKVPLPSNTGSCAVSANGVTAAFTSTADNSLTLVDTATRTATRYALPDASAAPSKCRFAPDGTKVYVTAGNDKLYAFTIAGTTWASVALNAGAAPTWIALNADGSRAMVVCPGTGEVAQVTTSGLSVAHVYTVPSAKCISFHPTSAKAYATGFPSSVTRVYEIDTDAQTITSGNNVGNLTPVQSKMFSDGTTMQIACSDTGAGSTQVLQVNIPERTNYTSWKNGTGPNVGDGANVAALGIGLTYYGSIIVPTTNALNVWFGSQFYCRHSNQDFAGELCKLSIRGAT